MPQPIPEPTTLYDADPKSPTYRQLLVLELYLPSLSFDPSEHRRPFFGSNFTGLRAKEIHIFVASQKEMTDLSIDASAKGIVADLVNRGEVSIKIRPDLKREAVVRRGDREDPLAVRLRATYFASMATTYGDQEERERIAWDAAAQLARKLVRDEMRRKLEKAAATWHAGVQLAEAELADLRRLDVAPGDNVQYLAIRAVAEIEATRALLGQEEA